MSNEDGLTELEREIPEGDFVHSLHVLEHEKFCNSNGITIHLTFIPFRSGAIDTNSFLEFIKRSVLVRYVLTCNEMKKSYVRYGELEADKHLFIKAIRKLSRATAQGKLGELLLYLLLEQLLLAPKIMTKISNLDDRNTHVKGADAVHAQCVDGRLILYLGESKMYQSYGDACRDAVNSMVETKRSYQEEFDLIESNIDFPSMTEEMERKVIDLLDPYGTDACAAQIRFPCFIGFDSNICQGVRDAEHYKDKYQHAAQDRIDTFFRHIHPAIPANDIHLILLPFASVVDFTAQFVTTLGIT